MAEIKATAFRLWTYECISNDIATVFLHFRLDIKGKIIGKYTKIKNIFLSQCIKSGLCFHFPTLLLPCQTLHFYCEGNDFPNSGVVVIVSLHSSSTKCVYSQFEQTETSKLIYSCIWVHPICAGRSCNHLKCDILKSALLLFAGTYLCGLCPHETTPVFGWFPSFTARSKIEPCVCREHQRYLKGKLLFNLLTLIVKSA